MKRLHTLVNLAKTTAPGLEDNSETPEVVEQPGEGQPVVQDQATVLAADAQSEEKRAEADAEIPADGTIPVEEVPAVSQESTDNSTVNQAPVSTETNPESGKPDNADGNEPATPADAAAVDNTDARADVPESGAKPSELAPELEQKDPKAAQPTFDEKAPASTPAADPNNPSQAASTEALTPEDLATVTQIAAVAGKAAAEQTVAEPATVETPAVAEASPPAAADAVAAEVATDAGQVPPVEPATGEQAATPAQAAQATADIIASNPEAAGEVAQAIDQVADAAVAADSAAEAENSEVPADGTVPVETTDVPPTDADAAGSDDASAEDTEEEKGKSKLEEELDEIDELADDAEVSNESLLNAREFLSSLEALVETALQNGGLSDDAAEILQNSVNYVTSEAGMEPTPLGLESIAYADRVTITEYALSNLRAATESLDNNLEISTEGLFDIFKSFNTKMLDWVKEKRQEVVALRGRIKDPKKSVKVTIDGDNGRMGFLELHDRSAMTLATLMGKYADDVVAAMEQLGVSAAKLKDGDTDYDQVALGIKGIAVPKSNVMDGEVPPKMRAAGSNIQASHVLLGGKVLVLSVNGKESAATIVDTDISAEDTVTGETAVTALDTVERLLKKIEAYIQHRVAFEKGASNASGQGTPKALALAFFFSYLSLLSPDVRRRIARLFKSDVQGAKLAELKAAFALTTEAAKASRGVVSEIISVAGKLAD